MMNASSASWFRRNSNGALQEPPRRIRRYLGMQIFATMTLLGAGGMLVSDAVNSGLGGAPVSLVAGATLTAAGLICFWNLVRPN
jgi:hypothetical protein